MNVIVIGGGASGMAAAITAAQRRHTVTLLERQARVGRKLLSTGNGRCNLSNAHADGSHYHGDAALADAVLKRPELGLGNTMSWFEELGLYVVGEPGGRLYPRSDTATSVLDVLRFALERLGVNVITGSPVTGIHVKDHHFTVTTEEGVYASDAVILAAGGAAGAKVGGVMDGYRIAKGLGHHRTALFPAIVQLRTDPTWPRSLKGVKAQADVAILRRGEVLARRCGEILFTEYGVSGPAVFDVSRAASLGGDGLVCRLDLLPGQDEAVTFADLAQRRERMAPQESQLLLTGLLHPRLGQTVCRAAGFTTRPAGELSDDDLLRIAQRLHRFDLPVLGVCGFDQAQVTAGGLRTDEFDPQTLESRIVPGFYACGEVLDVDGDCGGFNLQWAWSSGRLAGELLSNGEG
jgi:predicted Rossmann fold flavoprotein